VNCEKNRLGVQWKLGARYQLGTPPAESRYAPFYKGPRLAVARFDMARLQTGLLPACCILENQWKLSSRA
jgi:hypothetical protein